MKERLISGLALCLIFGLSGTSANADKVNDGKAPFMVEKGTGKKFYVRPVAHEFKARHTVSNAKACNKPEKTH